MEIVATTVVTIITLLILAAFLSAALGNISTSRSSSKGTNDGSTPKEKVYPARRSPYRATSIVNRSNTCSAVKKLLNFRFLDLDKALPSLPVFGCNAGHCNCEYVRHADRRDDTEDRRALHSLETDLYELPGMVNRRVAANDRRKEDPSMLNFQY